MNKTCVKKPLAIAVILLFITVSVAQSTETVIVEKTCMPTNRGKTLYVGGTGEGNYSSIQAAINDASDGDTVFVYSYSSPYYENVVVDKSINLIGEDMNNTVIEGIVPPVVISITRKWVNVSGFTIQYDLHESQEPCFCISIGWNDKSIITGNIIRNAYYGINVDFSYDNIIYGNVIENTTIGILLSNSMENCIYRNTISDNTNGIGLDGWEGSVSNLIYQNNITKNGNGIYFGSVYGGISGNFVYQNVITKNERGIYLSEGLTGGVTDNHIYQNNILHNWIGLMIAPSNGDGYVTNNYIYQNNFIDNILFNARIGILTNIYKRNYWDYNDIGNYWDNYIGLIFPKIFDKDGNDIGDIPYWILPFWKFQRDRYPLMEPYDIGVQR